MIDTNIFRKISYGLYVIGSTRKGAFNGQIANTVLQISSEPATIAVSINKNNLTCEFIKASMVFSVCILPASAGLDFIGRFGFKSGRDTDKYQGLSYRVGITGAPLLLEQSLGFIEAEVINSLEVETHIVFIGKVVNSEVLSINAEPMTYAYYHQVKKGLVPPAAPTYIKESEKAENNAGEKEREDNMKKYECTVCGYVYDPAVGDPDSGIAPGTAFENLPADWVCPVCGAGKDQFEPVS